ncbi:MAG: hypothetical protein KIT13_04000 [Burkholderiales bacterium]|nr:hypothetical protein [Burkholderiales bacterium]
MLLICDHGADDAVCQNHPERSALSEIRADVQLLACAVVTGIASWTGLCRLLRGKVLKLRELEYVQAAPGASAYQFLFVMMRHLT